MVRRMDFSTTSHAQAVAIVASGKITSQPPPLWMAKRTDAKLQMVRGGKGYAVLPFGGTGVSCSQRLEVLLPDGTSCGARDYPIAAGACDTRDLALSADGT